MALNCGRACIPANAPTRSLSRLAKRTSSYCARLIAVFAVVLCCAMTTIVFTACSSDDDDNTKKSEQDATKYGVMECTLYTSDESLASFDFFVKYYDDNGQVQSEKVAWDEKLDSEGLRTWTKKFKAKLPATLGVLFEMKPKDGIDPEAQHIFARGYNMFFRSTTSTDKVISSYGPIADYKSSRNKKGEFENALKENSCVLNIIYQYDINGKGTASKWE